MKKSIKKIMKRTFLVLCTVWFYTSYSAGNKEQHAKTKKYFDETLFPEKEKTT